MTQTDPRLRRLAALRGKLQEAGADAFVSLAAPDNQYLTGFLGSTSAVLVTADAALLLCDPRYTEQAGNETAHYEVREVTGGFMRHVGEQLARCGSGRAAYDPACLTVAQLHALEEAYKGVLQPAPGLVASLRLVKSSGEIERIRAASQLAESVVAELLAEFKEGVTEQEWAARFDYEVKRRGAKGPAFDTIALFGARSSLPHGQPGAAELRRGDIVLLDLGCRLDGYCSDLTRTYAFATIPAGWFEEIYAITRAAQKAALDAVRPGMRGRELDAVARRIIAEAGYANEFGHGLGHGVGIEIHEGPRLNSESETTLEPGMVVTIEPGIYLPGRGGVRIEDLVVVTDSGCEVLTHTPKELRILEV